MRRTSHHWLKDESGITALETAIILIAFVVVVAIFAFSVLTTGTFLTERSKEATYSGLQEVRGSLMLKGSVVLENSGSLIVFNVSTATGGAATDLSRLKITFRDVNRSIDLRYNNGTMPGMDEWSVVSLAIAPTPVTLLQPGDLAKIKIMLTNPIVHDQTFALQVVPQNGGVLLIERTAPAQITTITDLH
jgi:flagellin FlaB